MSYGSEPEPIDTTRIARVMYGALVNGGPHAYGYMRYDGETVKTFKKPGRVDTKKHMKEVCELIGATEPVWVVGHVRWATHGAPENNVNNHPVHHGRIVGVHNGVLRNHEDILKVTGRQDSTAIVDSEAIFAAVNKWGHAPGLRKIIGDMVSVYADLRKPHLVHIARTYGRSLAIGWTDRGNIVFASERQALLRLEAHGVKYIEDISTVREMRHLVLRNGEIIYRHTFGKVPVPVTPTYPRAGLYGSPPDPSWHRPEPQRRMTNAPIDTGAKLREAVRQDLIEELEDYEPKFGSKVDNDTYYYHGRLMSADEYVDTLADEMDWSDFDG